MATNATKVMCLLIIMGLAVPSLAADYYVGGLLGWLPVSNLLNWVLGKTFVVGDVLHFVSIPALPVYLVNANAYAACNVSLPQLTDLTGNFVYKLTQPGQLYFISDLLDCTLGLKLALNVASI